MTASHLCSSPYVQHFITEEDQGFSNRQVLSLSNPKLCLLVKSGQESFDCCTRTSNNATQQLIFFFLQALRGFLKSMVLENYTVVVVTLGKTLLKHKATAILIALSSASQGGPCSIPQIVDVSRVQDLTGKSSRFWFDAVSRCVNQPRMSFHTRVRPSILSFLKNTSPSFTCNASCNVAKGLVSEDVSIPIFRKVKTAAFEKHIYEKNCPDNFSIHSPAITSSQVRRYCLAAEPSCLVLCSAMHHFWI